MSLPTDDPSLERDDPLDYLWPLTLKVGSLARITSLCPTKGADDGQAPATTAFRTCNVCGQGRPCSRMMVTLERIHNNGSGYFWACRSCRGRVYHSLMTADNHLRRNPARHLPLGIIGQLCLTVRRAILIGVEGPFTEDRLRRDKCEWCHRTIDLIPIAPVVDRHRPAPWLAIICRECLDRLPKIRAATVERLIVRTGRHLLCLAALGLPGDICREVGWRLVRFIDVREALVNCPEVVE